MCEIFCKFVAFPNKERYNITSERKLVGICTLLALPSERHSLVPARWNREDGPERFL